MISTSTSTSTAPPASNSLLSIASNTESTANTTTATTIFRTIKKDGGLLERCAIVVAKYFQEDTKQYLSDELLTRVQKHMTKEAQIRYLGVYKKWFSNSLLFKFNTYNAKTGRMALLSYVCIVVTNTIL